MIRFARILHQRQTWPAKFICSFGPSTLSADGDSWLAVMSLHHVQYCKQPDADSSEVLPVTISKLYNRINVSERVHTPAQQAYLSCCSCSTSLSFLQAIANELTTVHNNALAELLPAFAADHLDASVILFNFEAFLIQLAQNATALGITDTTTPCYTGAVAGSATTLANTSAVCSNPNNHAYWDGVHPTGRVHELWGQAVAAQLMPYASTTSSSSRKLLAQERSFEGAGLGGIWIYGQPL